MLSISAIRRALEHDRTIPLSPSRTMAAVALVLAGRPDALHLCFILRATRHSDRWSGQMAFPGGKADPQDPTTESVAIRETSEELGLDLTQAERLGPVEPVAVPPIGSRIDTLSPFTFYWGPQLPQLRLNPHEVARSFWIPLDHLWDGAQRDSVQWIHKGIPMRFPGIRYEGHVIWGLTFRVLVQWSTQLGHPLPGPTEEPIRR